MAQAKNEADIVQEISDLRGRIGYTQKVAAFCRHYHDIQKLAYSVVGERLSVYMGQQPTAGYDERVVLARLVREKKALELAILEVGKAEAQIEREIARTRDPLELTLLGEERVNMFKTVVDQLDNLNRACHRMAAHHERDLMHTYEGGLRLTADRQTVKELCGDRVSRSDLRSRKMFYMMLARSIDPSVRFSEESPQNDLLHGDFYKGTNCSKAKFKDALKLAGYSFDQPSRVLRRLDSIINPSADEIAKVIYDRGWFDTNIRIAFNRLKALGAITHDTYVAGINLVNASEGIISDNPALLQRQSPSSFGSGERHAGMEPIDASGSAEVRADLSFDM
jgi:hypothetical protein